jgi:hypothetical protein
MFIFNKEEDFWDGVIEYCYEITDDELKQICDLKPEDILNHMKKSVGVLTPTGQSKFIPCIMLGNLEISVQISYQLWSMRTDANLSMNAPITQEEFDVLVPNIDHRNIDVRILYAKKTFIPATQMSLREICDFLGESIIGE